MDLAYRCRRHRDFVKRREQVAPIRTQVVAQDLIALRSRHIVRAVLDSLENIVNLFRQHFRIYND